jgi:hypothetical protein
VPSEVHLEAVGDDIFHKFVETFKNFGPIGIRDCARGPHRFVIPFPSGASPIYVGRPRTPVRQEYTISFVICSVVAEAFIILRPWFMFLIEYSVLGIRSEEDPDSWEPTRTPRFRRRASGEKMAERTGRMDSKDWFEVTSALRGL